MYDQVIKIENRLVGGFSPAFIVAEIGINHNGDMELAKKTIDAAVEAGVDSVKFQNYYTEDFLSPQSNLSYRYQSEGKDIVESQYEMFKRCELTSVNLIMLKEHCAKSGVIFHSTPTSEAGVDLLVGQDVKVLKNGSDFLTNSKLLEYMGKTNLPVVIATGMANENEIEIAANAVRNTGNDRLIVLHCTSSYPTAPEHVNLRKIISIKSKLKCLVGFSDHSEGSQAAVGAVALGACWIEKHFTLDKALPGPDHRFSSNLEEMKNLVREVRCMEKLLGSEKLIPAESELSGRDEYRLSCAASHSLKAGHVLTEEDIVFKRPGSGLPAYELKSILGRSLSQDVEKFQILLEEDLVDLK
ncbi:N-acetylneuraminate synthase family protein [bacterium]|nr:N-acetylneuraminate synthase family protein [bacterium]QQR59913.1 MAG: N-acetylneuraminate synthase family protein [Candidatus Melainabacteria bacterium]